MENKINMENKILGVQEDKKIKFNDIYGNPIKECFCKFCNAEISTLPHINNKEGFICLSCGIDKGFIKL